MRRRRSRRRSKEEEDTYCDGGERSRYVTAKVAMACRNVATVGTESPIAHVEPVRRTYGDAQVEEKEEEPRGGRQPGHPTDSAQKSPIPRVTMYVSDQLCA